MSPTDRRTVGELLADCDALARETLLDATFDHAPAMVRSWNQLVGSAAKLWAALPCAPDNRSESDPMERLRVVGEAIGRSVRVGHWPGQGPTDEHLTQMGDNLSRARHLVERQGRPSQPKTAEVQAQLQQFQSQLMHTLYVAAHGTAVALGAYVTDLQDRLQIGTRRWQPLAERPTALEITSARGMIARFDGFEQLAAAYLFGMPPTSANPDQTSVAAPATRLETALAVWEVQAHRTLANRPEAADLVRVARVQALITSTTGILTEAAATKGHIDGEVIRRLTPALEASQAAWNRTAKRWGELTNPASRTDPSLIIAASEVRAAIAAIATNQTGWATPDQLAARVDLPKTVKSLHLSMIASVDIAYVIRDTAVDHPGLIAPARIIGTRAQGEAELAIEQGETRYEGVTWSTPHQIAANQLIPLPEPARRGLINLADSVIASTNRAVAAAAQLDTSRLTRINEIRSCNVSRTLIRVPSDDPPTKSSAKRTMPMIWPPPAEQGAQRLLAPNPLPTTRAPGTRGWYATAAAMEIFVSACGVTRPGRKGTRSWNCSWPRHRGGRHAEGGPQRRVLADHSRAVGVDQDRPLAARIGRLDAPRRSPECGAGGR